MKSCESRFRQTPGIKSSRELGDSKREIWQSNSYLRQQQANATKTEMQPQFWQGSRQAHLWRI